MPCRSSTTRSRSAWNKDTLKKASQLEKGTMLKYEKPSNEPSVERNGDPYLIKKGDTLATIADDIYAKPSKWKKLWANNRSLVRNPNRIYAGFYLYYQITEQEKQLAEQIKAKRGNAPASAASAAPAGGDAAAAAPAAVAPAAPSPGAAGANNGAGNGALKPGGLSGLGGAAPRAPASAAPAAPAGNAKK
ncbi:MAG: LysM peptidoglycan-binding domain-containing protein [Deltaproteobacteria bacterium]|nr:LysM peptidoglycan-binding domain-containing protein [Deltaproteobacteria bacterium]